jgi:diguanylate cyclase (GGDEF)-like protein/PAS domain S-box-containing protein
MPPPSSLFPPAKFARFERFAKFARFARGRQIASWPWLALVFVLAAGVTLSVHEAQRIRAAEAALLQQNFDKDVDDALAQVHARVVAQEQLLRAGLGLYTSSDDVSRNEWHSFTQQMRLGAQYAGLRSLGYASLAAKPPPEDAHDRVTVVYIEPTELSEPGGRRNAVMQALDMSALPVLQTAMAQARDSGEAAISGKLELAALPGEPGAAGIPGVPAEVQTVMFMPVYRGLGTPASTAERRAALKGFVFGFARMDELVESALLGQVDGMAVELYDGRLPVPEGRIYSARTEQSLGAKPTLERAVQFDMGQRGWTLRFEGLPAYEATMPAGRSNSVLVAGLLLTLLFTAALGILMQLRARAERRAASMGSAYRRSEARAQTIVAHTAEGILTTDANGRLLSVNPAAEAIFGAPSHLLVGQPLERLLPLPIAELPSNVAGPVTGWGNAGGGGGGGETLRRELSATTPDGRALQLRVAASIMVLDGQPGFVVMVSDMTQQKESEQAAARIAQLNTAILQSAPFMVVSSDREGTIQSVNAATERMLWYRRDELVGQSVFDTLLLPEELAAHAAQASIDLGMHVPPRAIGARALRGLADESEWTLLRKDGSALPVNMALAAMRDARGMPTGFVGIAYDISERKRSESYIRHLAHHDALTALPNRVLLQDRVEVAIEHAKRGNRQVAVMLLDLDHFKQINDSLGHGVGDAVLQEVATRLRNTVRHSDTVARMGGDEFCVVLSDMDERGEASLVAHKILEAVRPAMVLGTRELHITVSIGIALYPDDGAELATLLQNADIAMYASKRQGRNAFEAFAPAMQADSTLRLSVEEGLRSALVRGELVLHYQPKVALAGGGLLGVEALLRWNRPGHGLVAPSEFIGMAEDSGLIVPIGEWVLRQACADAVRLQQRLGYAVPMAVNMSPRQFRQTGLLRRVEDALADAGLAPEHLELEITESVLIEDTNVAAELLQALHRRGVRLTIDDFGTGFSSLSYLHRFPVSTLKIDQSFIADLPTNRYSEAIVASVVGLARSLKLHVVAEGVETIEQHQRLCAHQCEGGQGYLFSHPLAFEALCSMLEAKQGAESMAA